MQASDEIKAKPSPMRRLYFGAVGLWLRLRNTITAGLFGVSGATTVASVQHALHTCSAGNCAGCGRCAVALLAAVAAASGGIAGRTKGRRRWGLIAVVVVIGLALYALIEAWKRGLLPFPG